MTAGETGPLRFISTSSVSQLRSASRKKRLLKPISRRFPDTDASMRSLALPSAVTADTFIMPLSTINLMGLLVFSVIIIEVRSITSISSLVPTLITVVVSVGTAE